MGYEKFLVVFPLREETSVPKIELAFFTALGVTGQLRSIPERTMLM